MAIGSPAKRASRISSLFVWRKVFVISQGPRSFWTSLNFAGAGVIIEACEGLLFGFQLEVVKKITLTNGLIMILDNFKMEDERGPRLLEEIRSETPQARWICIGEEPLPTVGQQAKPAGFEAVYIGPLRRTIRELSERWCAHMGRDGQRAYEAVMTQLQRTNLPRTGYIVALLLWAMHRSREHQRLNEAVLLENVVEHLLEKTDFTRALRKEFDFRAKEITLQSLGKFLKERGNYAEINEILSHIIQFLGSLGLVYSAGDVLNALLETGVVDRTGDVIHFKYKCF